jgi:hypothetical protein
LFSPPKPPTPEQAKQQERAAVEEDRHTAFRAYVAGQSREQSAITDQARTQQREREQEAKDQFAREQRQRDIDRSR